MSKQTALLKTNSSDINGAKIRLAAFDRELESAAHLLQEFERENPFGFNRFLQLRAFIFLTALLCWLLAYKLIESGGGGTGKFMLAAAVGVGVIAAGLTLTSARNLFVTVRGWQTMKTLQKTAWRIEILQAEAQAAIASFEL